MFIKKKMKVHKVKIYKMYIKKKHNNILYL